MPAARPPTDTLTELIIGGSLTSVEIAGSAREDPAATADARVVARQPDRARRLQNQFTNLSRKALFLFERGPLALVAGAGVEPATSGL
jgi:hypothetical protein